MAIRYHLHQAHVRHFITEAAKAELGDDMRGDGLTWFADRIGVTLPTLSRVLSGKQPLSHEMALRITHGLELPHDLIYTFDYGPEPSQEVAS